MMNVSYLSPTSLTLWEKNRLGWYARYVYGVKDEATPAMKLGGDFDCRVKRALGWDGEVAASADADRVWEAYRACGAWDDLQREIEVIITTYGGNVTCEGRRSGVVAGVPVVGIPDVVIGGRFLLDWKVNGFYSSASPKPGYVVWRGGRGGVADRLWLDDGIICAGLEQAEAAGSGWMTQLSLYQDLLGSAVSDMVCGIDQICGPKAGVASFRGRIPDTFRVGVRDRLARAWDEIHSSPAPPREVVIANFRRRLFAF